MAKASISQLLESITPYERSTYENVDLTGLAAFTLNLLHERHIPTTFENIVVVLYRLFPTKFSLEGYPEYPDAARVGRTLLQLAPKYRNWARGSVQKGFVLTESGLSKVAQVCKILAGQQPRQVATNKRQVSPRTMDLSKELEPLETSQLFNKWKEKKLNEGTELEFLDMLGAYAYTPPRAIRDRINVLENAASQLNRIEIIDFLKDVRKTFKHKLQEV